MMIFHCCMKKVQFSSNLLNRFMINKQTSQKNFYRLVFDSLPHAGSIVSILRQTIKDLAIRQCKKEHSGKSPLVLRLSQKSFLTTMCTKHTPCAQNYKFVFQLFVNILLHKFTDFDAFPIEILWLGFEQGPQFLNGNCLRISTITEKSSVAFNIFEFYHE